ncbi:glycosyltransferase [Gordonia sp. NPDC058843]|uniref:glycosyltransferase n=1 Tax=Gordonia sp. NPDC058843 TaxID=3346648 RepID=UPI0036898638
MRIAFVINGTRGDVQPATILARALARRGHDVCLGVPPNLADSAKGWTSGVGGVDVMALGMDTRAHIETVTSARTSAGRNPIRRFRAVLSLRNVGWDQLVTDMAEVVAGADVIVTGLVTEQPALAFAEGAGVPLVSVHHAPVRRNRKVGPVPGHVGGGSRSIRIQWAVYDAAFTLLTRGRDARLRTRLGLPATSRCFLARLRAAPGVELQAYDPLFGVDSEPGWASDSRRRPRPSVGFLGSPGVRRGIGGSGSATPAARAEARAVALTEWLDAGDAPIYVGFGSMPLRGQKATLEAVAELGRRLGRRVLMCAGWTELDADVRAGVESAAVRIESQVDHRAVFGRCAVVVHHGGAGTTAAVLRAGRPSVICWYGADQPFWGAELERLGVGVSMPMARARDGLDVDRLCGAVRSMLDPSVARRAGRLRAVLVDEDAALGHAVREIEGSVRRSSTGEPHSRSPQVHSGTKVDV